jgi:hypothetical protein
VALNALTMASHEAVGSRRRSRDDLQVQGGGAV